MSKCIVRHDVSEANDKNLPAYGKPEAALLEMYSNRAKDMGKMLLTIYGIDPSSSVAAVSTMRRSQDTAIGAGFSTVSVYPTLDEVSHLLTPLEILKAKESKQPPRQAITSAEILLQNPPAEQVWITHGLIIAGLCEVLDVSDQYDFIARFCEIRELPI